MKLFTCSNFLMLVPVAMCLAQTPPPAQTPKPTTPAAPATKPMPIAPALEDIPGSDPVVLTIGEEKITKSAFERLLATLPPQMRSRPKKDIAEQIIQVKTLAQEARKRGLDKTAETKEMIALAIDNVLANAVFKDLSTKIKVDDAAAQSYYNEHKAEFDSVTAKHILIRYKGSQVPLRPGQKELTDEEALAKAQDLKKRIAGGEDFGKLAMAESDDAQSGKEGGSLGSFSHGRMVPAFEEAAFKLPAGQLSDPVKTQFGYHLILVEKHSSQTFDEVKLSIEQRLKPELSKKAMDDLRKNAGVVMNESYFAK